MLIITIVLLGGSQKEGSHLGQICHKRLGLFCSTQTEVLGR
jgi:hypothetical protein